MSKLGADRLGEQCANKDNCKRPDDPGFSKCQDCTMRPCKIPSSICEIIYRLGGEPTGEVIVTKVNY
jgi:hypothetical protein